MPVARRALAGSAQLFAARLLAGLALAGLALGALALPAGAQAPSTARQCADRWNEMKARDQTGDLTYRQFSASCMAGTGPTPATSAVKPEAARPAANSALPPGSIKQCADRWNAMKANGRTGDLTYRDFSRKCLAEAVAGKPAEKPATPAEAARPRTSVPSAGIRPDARTAAAVDEDESDREAVTRCNGQWKQEKERRNLSGAKAWHTFMARCL